MTDLKGQVDRVGHTGQVGHGGHGVNGHHLYRVTHLRPWVEVTPRGHGVGLGPEAHLTDPTPMTGMTHLTDPTPMTDLVDLTHLTDMTGMTPWPTLDRVTQGGDPW
jgi:hypothetical protein